jgi:hypothetical protein
MSDAAFEAFDWRDLRGNVGALIDDERMLVALSFLGEGGRAALEPRGAWRRG